MTAFIHSIRAAAKRIASRTALRPTLAVVLGSGFQRASAQLRIEAEIPYAKLPGFPKPGVGGHAGKVLLGRFGDAPVLVLSGRAHFYEGHSIETVTFPIRVLAEFGIRDILLTNAAGGINRKLKPGDLMRIVDHVNLMGANPLRGELPSGRERFVDLSRVYNPDLAKLLDRAAGKSGVPLRRGVYLAVSGPSYETPAEIRAFSRLGADAVGMSTVPEAIVARQCGLRVAGVSCITNLAAGVSRRPLSHEEVLATGRRVSEQAAELIESFVRLHEETR